MLALMSGWNLPSLEWGGFTCAPRRRVGVPKTNFFTQVAPAKPAKLVPSQAGANTLGTSISWSRATVTASKLAGAKSGSKLHALQSFALHTMREAGDADIGLFAYDPIGNPRSRSTIAPACPLLAYWWPTSNLFPPARKAPTFCRISSIAKCSLLSA